MEAFAPRTRRGDKETRRQGDKETPTLPSSLGVLAALALRFVVHLREGPARLRRGRPAGRRQGGGDGPAGGGRAGLRLEQDLLDAQGPQSGVDGRVRLL